MPAEWEEHEGTVVYWPGKPEQYLYGSASDYSQVTDAFVGLIDIICAFEPVKLGVDPSRVASAAERVGKRAELFQIPLDDAWARDAAPTFLVSGAERAAVCWRYTGWGGRFGPIEKDANAARGVADFLGATPLDTSLALEGGAIHSDGSGTFLTTESVLFDPGRNPGRDRDPLEQELLAIVGGKNLVVLPCGFEGDDTGGHVDVIAAFAPGGVVLTNDCEDSSDPNSLASRKNRKVLSDAGLEIVGVPQPEARFVKGDRLAYSYLNFYVLNGAVLYPVFEDKSDSYAGGLLREHFPDREIIPFDARPFYLGGGGIHCVTQQIPKIEPTLDHEVEK